MMNVARVAQASTSGNVGVINLLLKKGADVSVTDKDGVTTLMSAASHGHAQVRTCCLLAPPHSSVVVSCNGSVTMGSGCFVSPVVDCIVGYLFRCKPVYYASEGMVS